jgi:hypothetical protein
LRDVPGADGGVSAGRGGGPELRPGPGSGLRQQGPRQARVWGLRHLGERPHRGGSDPGSLPRLRALPRRGRRPRRPLPAPHLHRADQPHVRARGLDRRAGHHRHLRERPRRAGLPPGLATGTACTGTEYCLGGGHIACTCDARSKTWMCVM